MHGWVLLFGLLLIPPAANDGIASAVEAYAQGCFVAYSAALSDVREMRARVLEFCGSPDEAGLARAREAWKKARRSYGATEVYRFGGGPIDARRGGVETYVNAWPVDENCIEPADPGALVGIIRDRARHPVLARAVVRELNQRGGETNICTGWHAVEFMLWGRDTSPTGPGCRPASDFVDGRAPHADRRREFLVEITELLCEDLARVANQWAPSADNHRRRFTADPQPSLRAMFAGPALLAGFEMSGERLAVALETRDQEEEQSCFSDTTSDDFRADIRGIIRVLRGEGGASGGLIGLVRARNSDRGQALAASLDAAVAAVDALPAPFDSAIRSEDGSPARKALEAAMAALERLGTETSAAAREFGIVLPSEPQG